MKIIASIHDPLPPGWVPRFYMWDPDGNLWGPDDDDTIEDNKEK